MEDSGKMKVYDDMVRPQIKHVLLHAKQGQSGGL